MSGTDFKKNPMGPSTGGARPPDFTRMTPPARETYPMPANGIPVPGGGRTPFGPPVYAQPGLGTQSGPAMPYKNLKG